MKQTVVSDTSPADDLEMNPQYQDMVEDMAEEFFAEHDPEFSSLMKAVQNGERSLPCGNQPSSDE